MSIYDSGIFRGLGYVKNKWEVDRYNQTSVALPLEEKFLLICLSILEA